MAVFTQFLLGVCLSLDPIPTQELCLNMGFWILDGLLSILILQPKQLNLPVAFHFCKPQKAGGSQGQNRPHLKNVLVICNRYLFFQQTVPNCSEKSIFKEDISINKWSYNVKVIKRYKMAYRTIFTHLTSQLLIRVTTSLNVIWVNVLIT